MDFKFIFQRIKNVEAVLLIQQKNVKILDKVYIGMDHGESVGALYTYKHI